VTATNSSATRTWELLGRGGSATNEEQAILPAKYSGLADSDGAEELGRELAGRVRPLAPAAIVIWEEPEDVVLGHVVGRELGLPVVRAFDADGLVGHSAGLPADPRVVLVTDAVRDGRVVRAAQALAEQQGGALIGTAVLIETPALRESGTAAGTIVALVRAADEPEGAA
jgi:adenine/guanine phosphoribosyltransferase-like PRPP-binding protein